MQHAPPIGPCWHLLLVQIPVQQSASVQHEPGALVMAAGAFAQTLLVHRPEQHCMLPAPPLSQKFPTAQVGLHDGARGGGRDALPRSRRRRGGRL
jgi:hypothetical protein